MKQAVSGHMPSRELRVVGPERTLGTLTELDVSEELGASEGCAFCWNFGPHQPRSPACGSVLRPLGS